MAELLVESDVATESVRLFENRNFLMARLFPEEPVRGSITAKWDVLKMPRTVPPASVGGSPATRRNPIVRSRKSFTMARIRLRDLAAGVDMRFGVMPGSQTERYGMAAVRDKLFALTAEIEFAKEFARASALTGSYVITYEDGTTVTVDLGFATTHKPTAGVTWATTTTNIIADIMTWKKLVQQDSGQDPAELWIDDTVAGYLINNTTIQNYMKEPVNAGSLIRDGRLARLCGLDVVQYNGGYDASGTFTQFIDSGHVIIVPRPADAGMQMLTGQSEDVRAADNPGLFSKTWMEEDPSGIHCLVEQYFMPVIKVPDAVVYADIVP